MLMNIQMNSPSLMRSSLKPDVTTSRCWRLPWLIRHNLMPHDLVSRSMATLVPPLLDTLPKQTNDTLALSPKVGTVQNDSLFESSTI